MFIFILFSFNSSFTVVFFVHHHVSLCLFLFKHPFLIFNHDFIPLLYHIQLVHLLSLPAMSANLHLLFPMHVSRQKVGFGGGASIYIYIYRRVNDIYIWVIKYEVR